MAKVVNLNRYRKERARDDRRKKAEANRIEHGRTKEERRNARLERERAQADLASKRLDGRDGESDDPDGA